MRASVLATLHPLAKDIMLYLAGKYGDDFAQNMSIEFAGSLVPQLSIDSRACLATHGVEVAAKFAIFPADEKTHESLSGHTAARYTPLAADPDVEYENEIVVDVDEMPFVVAKPHQFGNVVPVDEVKGVQIDQALIGSCANGRYEDIEIAARLLKGRINPALHDLPFDSLKDFVPVSLIAQAPFLLVVTPSLPVKSVKDLIAAEFREHLEDEIARFKKLAIDQRGFGCSDAVAADYQLTTARYVEDLAEVILEVAKDSVHLVAGKSGGISVMVLSATHHERARTVTASCTPVTPPAAQSWIEEMERDGIRSWAKRTQRSRMGSRMSHAGIDGGRISWARPSYRRPTHTCVG